MRCACDKRKTGLFCKGFLFFKLLKRTGKARIPSSRSSFRTSWSWFDIEEVHLSKHHQQQICIRHIHRHHSHQSYYKCKSQHHASTTIIKILTRHSHHHERIHHHHCYCRTCGNHVHQSCHHDHVHDHVHHKIWFHEKWIPRTEELLDWLP